MKARFLKQLQAQKSQITLDGQRVQIPSYSRVAKPRSLSRNARKNQSPEVDLTLIGNDSVCDSRFNRLAVGNEQSLPLLKFELW